jgi:Carboxypeptidase regulatory-like domain
MKALPSVREISSYIGPQAFTREWLPFCWPAWLEVSLQKTAKSLRAKRPEASSHLLNFWNLPTIRNWTVRSDGASMHGVPMVRTQPIWLLILAVAAMTSALAAQEPAAPQNGTPQNPTAQITGTVVDASGDTLAGATVALQGPVLKGPIKLQSDDNGLFNFKQLDPGTYRVVISAPGFTDWTSPEILLNASQYFLLTGCELRLAGVTSTVNVTYQPEEVAMEQVKIEETQRVLGIIPNFYVVYDPNPAPLTTSLKFHLALKTSTDTFTILGTAALAGINQAGDTPNYQQGFKGYAERFGAVAGDGVSDIMIGGAILPSLLHQDPRYYYKGTGTNKSRALHALASPFVCKGDNGKLQPNFSSIGGDLSSSALSNLYYPQSNRGAGLVFQNVALTTGERMLSALVQEFVLSKLTPNKSKLRN